MKYDLSDLMTFDTVIAENGITAAARKMGISKSTVSLALTRLEADLGLKLVQRSTRRMQLTDAGIKLRAHTEKLTKELANTSRSLETFHENISGLIRIAAPTASGQFILPKLIATFRSEYPETSFKIELADEDIDMIADSVDVAFRTGHQKNSALITRQLDTFNIKLFASAPLIKALGKPIRLEDLDRYPHLYHPGIPAWTLTRGNDKQIYRPAQTIMSNNLPFLRQLLLNHQGIAALPTYLVGNDLAHGDVVTVLPRWQIASMPYSLTYPSRVQPSRAVATFIDFAVNYFKDSSNISLTA